MSRSKRDWLDMDGRFLFGKHKGQLAEEVVKRDFAYLQWIVEEMEDCSDDDREVLSALLTMRGVRGN